VRDRSHFTVLFLLWVVAAGCDSNKGIPSSAAAPTEPNSPVGTIAVRLQGVILDGDRDQPVPSAAVKVSQVYVGGWQQRVDRAWSATADADGVFGFTADLPSGWSDLLLDASRSGYEPSGTWLVPGTAASAVVRVLPTLSLRPGESLHTRVFRGFHACFFESWACRRVVVESPSGDLVDLEVIPADSGATVGLEGPESSHPLVPALNRRITASAGEIWIYGGGNGPSTAVMLTATRH
jgi:hypothetical protein